MNRFHLEATPALLAYSPTGDRFAAALFNEDRKWVLSIHESWNGRKLMEHEVADRISSFSWHPGGDMIVAADWAGIVSVTDARTGENRTLGRHKAQAVMTCFSPDGTYVFTGGWERELIGWRLGALEHALSIDLQSFNIQIRRDGRECVLSAPEVLQFHALEYPMAPREMTEDLGGGIRRAAFSPDGRWLAASGQESMGVWDLTTGASGTLAREHLSAIGFFARPPRVSSARQSLDQEREGAGAGRIVFCR